MERKTTIECGHESRGGTDWPVFCTVERDGKGRLPWLLTLGICNGTAQGTIRCRTKTIAVELAEVWRDQAGKMPSFSDVLNQKYTDADVDGWDAYCWRR